MAISNKLIDILCCPTAKKPVTTADKKILKKINAEIPTGKICYANGTVVDAEIKEALVTDNLESLYRVDDGIPVMLADKGISLRQPSLKGLFD